MASSRMPSQSACTKCGSVLASRPSTRATRTTTLSFASRVQAVPRTRFPIIWPRQILPKRLASATSAIMQSSIPPSIALGSISGRQRCPRIGSSKCAWTKHSRSLPRTSRTVKLRPNVPTSRRSQTRSRNASRHISLATVPTSLSFHQGSGSATRSSSPTFLPRAGRFHARMPPLRRCQPPRSLASTTMRNSSRALPNRPHRRTCATTSRPRWH